MRSRKVYILIFVVLFVASCASERYLRTEPATPGEMTGTFDLILYGSRYSDDIETVAILDVAESGYTFEPYAPAFDFRSVKGVPAKEAFERAEKFVMASSPDFWRIQVSRILNPENRTIGYEVRPLYFPIVHGEADVMYVDYWLKTDGVVKVTIKLKPEIDRLLRSGSGSGRGDGR